MWRQAPATASRRAGELGARELRLLALIEIAQHDRAFGELVLAEQHRMARAALHGALEALAGLAAELHLDRQAGGAQLLGQRSAASSAASPIGTTATGRGAAGVSSSSIASRSTPAAQPMPGVSGPPMVATSPS